MIDSSTSIHGASRRIRAGAANRVSIAVSIVLVGLVWQLLASGVPSFTFPKPLELIGAIEVVVTGGTEYDPVTNYGYTIARIGIATAVSLTVGVLAGILMGLNDTAKRYLYIVALSTFAFPSIIWALLGVLWFGLTTFLVPVFAVSMIVTPYVAIIIEEGIQDLDADLVEMGDAFGASSDQMWREIYIPHLYPHIFASARLTVTLAWKITIVAELFGTSNGVGQIILFFFEQLRNDMIIAWVLPMMVLMFGVEKLLRRIEADAFSWREEVTEVTAG